MEVEIAAQSGEILSVKDEASDDGINDEDDDDDDDDD